MAHHARAHPSRCGRPGPGALDPLPGRRPHLFDGGGVDPASSSSCRLAGPPVGGRRMKTASAALPLTRSRLADYVELTKPRIAVLVLFTVAAGGWLAGLNDGDGLVLLHTVCAT